MHPTDSILLITLLIVSFFAISLSDPRTSPAALICSNRSADPPHREKFVSNFLSVLDAVTPQIAARRFARASAGNSTNTSVFAFGECLRDLSDSDCDLCFATCKTMILRCLPFQKATRAGRNFLDGCFLRRENPNIFIISIKNLTAQGLKIRYEDHDFSGKILSADDRILCGNTSVVNQTEFSGIAAEIISNLSSAADTGGFAVGSTERGNSRVYGLAQCWEYMNASACRVCLKAAAENLSFCVPMAEGRALYSGCYMRYSTAKFFRSPEEIRAVKKGGVESTAVVIAAVFSTVAALAIISLLVFFFTRRWKKRRRVERLLGNLGEAVNKSKLNLEYGILERATNYFDVSNKLGQGGSGSVYKGVLPDSRTVAVKRLVFNTNQWADQFFSEVNLLSQLKHHNLVPLLGCSITGPESLLVYEYLPNHSLLLHLSDQVKSRHLYWPARCQILLGIAEGLAYLHEGSPLKIIHRDIKLSNILLDEQFNAKIADFGLARLLPDENTHLSTAIAGTLGYMAPEYLVRGKLTEKADVYSFGIVILETVCGRSRTAENAPPDPLSLLQNIWKLYTLGRLREAVDPCLEGEFEEDGAVRVLRIGLLCAQAAPELRPAMSEAAGMLRGEEGVPDPAPPPFLRFAASGSCSSPAPFCSEGSSVNSTTMSEVFPR